MALVQVDTKHVQRVLFAVFVCPLAECDVVLRNDSMGECVLRPLQHIRTCTHKLFAAVLFVEVKVCGWTEAVVEHDFCRAKKLWLCVCRVVHQRRRPLATLQDLPGEPHGRCCDEGWGVVQQAVIHERDLHKVLGNGACLDIIVVGFGNAAQEVHGRRIAQVKVEDLEHVSLSPQDLFIGIAAVCDVHKVLDRGAEHFLVFGRNK